MQTINNTNWYESKRAHWLQAHRHSAGCCWDICRFHKANTAFISKRTRTEWQNKRDNCNHHWHISERRQLSYRGRNRAIQLVVVETPVDFTKHILSLTADKHEQRDRSNEKNKSSLTSPWAQSIVRSRLGSCHSAGCCGSICWFHRTHTAVNNTRTRTERDSANDKIVIVTDKYWSAVNCLIEVAIVPLSRLS